MKSTTPKGWQSNDMTSMKLSFCHPFGVVAPLCFLKREKRNTNYHVIIHKFWLLRGLRHKGVSAAAWMLWTGEGLQWWMSIAEMPCCEYSGLFCDKYGRGWGRMSHKTRYVACFGERKHKKTLVTVGSAISLHQKKQSRVRLARQMRLETEKCNI